MNSDFLNRLHECELMILDEVVRFYKEHNIQYFLTAGSLLGAIRHNGVIPWDDDLDICMPQNDYNRFLNVAMECLDKRLFLDCCLTDRNIGFLMQKLLRRLQNQRKLGIP